MGAMTYRHASLEYVPGSVREGLRKRDINLKPLTDVDGRPKVSQLVGYRLEDITVHGAWNGDGRLDLIPHVKCRVADLPVRRIVGGRHMVVDFTLPYGTVLHDYLA